MKIWWKLLNSSHTPKTRPSFLLLRILLKVHFFERMYQTVTFATKLRLADQGNLYCYMTFHPAHFTPRTIHPTYNSPHVQFTPRTFHPTYVSTHVRFTPRTFHPTYVSPHVRFAPRIFHPKACHSELYN